MKVLSAGSRDDQVNAEKELLLEDFSVIFDKDASILVSGSQLS